MLQNLLPKVNRQVWIAVASTSIIAASAYPVFAKNERAGHDLFSSEKPEAVREVQEAKQREYREQLKQRQAEIKLEQARIQQHNSHDDSTGNTSSSRPQHFTQGVFERK